MNSARKWESCDITQIFSLHFLHKLLEDVKEKQSVELVENCPYPEFGAHKLKKNALTHLCSELELQAHGKVSSVRNLPSMLVANKMRYVWTKVMDSFNEFYSSANIQNVLAKIKKEETMSTGKVVTKGRGLLVPPEENVTGNTALVEIGIMTGMSVAFTLLKQAWSQLAWNRQLSAALSQIPGLELPPFMSTASAVINLPNEILKSVLDILIGIPSLSLSNSKTLSPLSWTCLKQCAEFLEWVVSPNSNVEAEGKRLALQILLSFSMQYGSLVELLEWVDKVLSLLVNHNSISPDVPHPSLCSEYCQNVLKEIRTRTVGHFTLSFVLVHYAG